jgi:hypothetical protein
MSQLKSQDFRLTKQTIPKIQNHSLDMQSQPISSTFEVGLEHFGEMEINNFHKFYRGEVNCPLNYTLITTVFRI